MTRLLTLVVILTVLAVGCGGGGGLVEGGSARRTDSPWGGRLAVDVRFAEGARLEVTGPGRVSLAVVPATTRLVIDLFELGDDDLVIPTTYVTLDFTGGDQYVLIQPIPAGTHLLRILGLDSGGALVSGFQAEVTIRAQEVTEVTALLTPRSSPLPVPDLRHLYTADRADDRISIVRGDGLGGFAAVGTAATVGDAPQGLSVDPDRKYLFVACGNPASAAGRTTLESYRVDRGTGALTRVSTVVLGDGDRAGPVAAGRSRVYVGLRGPGTVAGFAYEPDTGVLEGTAATSAGAPDAADLALGDRFLVVASAAGLRALSVTSAGDLGPVVSSMGPSGGVPSHVLLGEGRLFTGAGDRVLVHDVDSDGVLTNPRSVGLPGAAGLSLHESREFLYVAAAGALATFDVDRSTGNLSGLRTVAAVAGTPAAVVADPDGSHVLLTVSRGAGTAGVLQGYAVDRDTGTPTALTTLGVGSEPLGLVLVER